MGRGDSIDALERHSSLLGVPFRFGDLALILSEENTLEHVLTFIDRGVWFEKVGLGGGAPYRLITTADFYHRVENGRRVEWRRFNRGSFPHPAEVFKSIRQLAPVPGTDRTMILDPPLDGPLSFRQIHFLFDDMGRARLSEAAYREVNPRP